jgi:hypothetical protein
VIVGSFEAHLSNKIIKSKKKPTTKIGRKNRKLFENMCSISTRVVYACFVPKNDYFSELLMDFNLS